MIMLTLLGVTLSVGASDAPQGPIMLSPAGSLAPEVQWSDVKISDTVKKVFDTYVNCSRKSKIGQAM